MHSFNKVYEDKMRFHPATTWLIAQCAEARGMQELWKRARPEILKKLKESAIIQSAESSNRMEGVEVEQGRLFPLVFGHARPRDRPEEEIVGYKRALDYIHQNYNKIAITPKTILKLHALAQDGMVADAGQWKSKDNQIIEILPNGERRIRFECVKALNTPHAIEQLCLGYQHAIQNSSWPDITAAATFVFDFLCIHPFRDGNGRVSRLLTLLLLHQLHYEIGHFISLERLIEHSKEDYYWVLSESSKNWHIIQHDLTPWLNYFLGIIKAAYAELKTRVEWATSADSVTSVIRQIVLAMDGIFSISDLCKLNPTFNRESIKKALFALRDEKKIKMQGQGRGAKWIVL